jgi:UDP-glucose 4-epimerase
VTDAVLVTGGGAPLGRYVADALGDRGARVVSYDRARALAPDGVGEDALGELCDLPRLLHAIRERGVGHVVHAAEVADPAGSIEMPVATIVAGVEGTLHLLEAVRIAGLAGRIVLLSSSVVYGDRDGTIDESAPLRPRTPFAVAKATGEHLGGVYAERYGLDVVALRLGQAYGPQLALPPAVDAVLRAALGGHELRLAAGADQTFQLTHGEDVGRAVAAALAARDVAGRVFNVTGGEARSLAAIAVLVAARFPGARVELGPGPLPGLDRQGPLDIRAADRALGYRPRWGLARGLDDYVEWLAARSAAA